MNAGVGALGDDAEEAAGAPSPPLLSAAAPAPGAPSPPLLSAAAPAPGAPLASDVSGRGAGRAVRDLCDKVVERLVAGGRLEPSAFDSAFHEMLAIHFTRLPESYHLYMNDVNAEDVITHMKLLEEAMDPDRRPAIHVRFLRDEKPIVDTRTKRDDAGDTISTRPGLTHEIIFCSVHNDRLLSLLSAILSDVGLNVKHVHVFLTSEGLSLYAFTVQGWPTKNIIGLVEALKTSISTNERSWSIFCSPSYVTPPNLTAYCSSNSSRSMIPNVNSTSQTRTDDSFRRLQSIKMRKRAEKVKQQKMMESFRAILSDSVSFLFPAMLAIFTSSFVFHDFEKPFLIMVFSMGGLLILLNMVLSHGVDDGPGKTAVVSFLTLLTVIYVFGVFEYFLYKFFPAGIYQVTALHCIGGHFIFGVIMLRWLWANSFKTSSVCFPLNFFSRKRKGFAFRCIDR